MSVFGVASSLYYRTLVLTLRLSVSLSPLIFFLAIAETFCEYFPSSAVFCDKRCRLQVISSLRSLSRMIGADGCTTRTCSSRIKVSENVQLSWKRLWHDYSASIDTTSGGFGLVLCGSTCTNLRCGCAGDSGYGGRSEVDSDDALQDEQYRGLYYTMFHTCITE